MKDQGWKVDEFRDRHIDKEWINSIICNMHSLRMSCPWRQQRRGRRARA
jgi:hypothetical protein